MVVAASGVHAGGISAATAPAAFSPLRLLPGLPSCPSTVAAWLRPRPLLRNLLLCQICANLPLLQEKIARVGDAFQVKCKGQAAQLDRCTVATSVAQNALSRITGCVPGDVCRLVSVGEGDTRPLARASAWQKERRPLLLLLFEQQRSNRWTNFVYL